MSQKKTLIKLEHDVITSSEVGNNRFFKELHSFALTEKGRDVLIPGHEYVKIRNYVGVIQTRSGFVLEILPKIHEDDKKVEETRRVFTLMLRTLRRVPKYKHLKLADLRSEKMPLYEIFIAMFIDEVHSIVRKGIKSSYVNVEENIPVMKGKLVAGEHVTRNIVHRERFYISYDEYMEDIPKNRVIKSALLFCKKNTRWSKNQQGIHELLFVFDKVNIPLYPNSEYERIIYDRSADYYARALEWAMVFLGGKSFAPYSGSSIAYALLFPMELVFESYVYYCLKKHSSLIELTYQSSRYYLSTEGDNPLFMIKPDMVALSPDGQNRLILDAKWKVLDEDKKNEKYGISQSDMYQLLSYAEVYRKEKGETVELYLIYPRTGSLNDVKSFKYNINSETPIHIIPFDIQATVGGDMSCLKPFVNN